MLYFLISGGSELAVHGAGVIIEIALTLVALQRSGPASRDTVDFPIAANWPGTRVSTLDDVILELHLSDAQRRRLAFLRYIHGVNTNEELSRDIPGIIQRIKDGRIQTVHR